MPPSEMIYPRDEETAPAPVRPETEVGCSETQASRGRHLARPETVQAQQPCAWTVSAREGA